MILQKKKNSRIFQNFCSFKIRLIESIFWPIEMWGRKSVFSLKSQVPSIPSRFLSTCQTFLHVHFNSYLIPLDRLDFVFLKTYRNQFWLFQKFFVFLSNSSLDPFSQKLFFCRFLGQSFEGFLPNPKVRHFCPFFFIILHVFMHFLGIFALFKIWGFWCFWAFWSKLNHGFLFMHHIKMIHML